MRRWVGLFLGGLIALAVTGCSGDDEPSDLPSFSGAEPGASASASATAPAADVKGPLAEKGKKLGDPKNAITVGRTLRGDPEKEAVQQAYLAFWAERAASLRRVAVNEAALGAVATGPAADGVAQSVEELKSNKQHTEGGSVVNIQTVAVTGTTAKITDCFQDRSVDFTADGKPEKAPDVGYVPFGAELVKAANGWRVAELSDAKIKNCKA